VKAIATQSRLSDHFGFGSRVLCRNTSDQGVYKLAFCKGIGDVIGKAKNLVPERVLHRLRAQKQAANLHGSVPPQGHIPSAKRLYEAGQPVYHQGQPATHLFEVTSGVLKLSKMTEDGRCHVVEIVPRGWICGFSIGGLYDAACDALTEATAISYLKSDIDEADATDDRERLTHQMERQICDLHDHSLMLSRKSASERIASLLMRFISGRGAPNCTGPAFGEDDAAIEVPMSGKDIGDFLGLNAETVSREITRLSRKGLIKRAPGKRNAYYIIDVCNLCKAAHNDCEL